jgi:hypothetical protein
MYETIVSLPESAILPTMIASDLPFDLHLPSLTFHIEERGRENWGETRIMRAEACFTGHVAIQGNDYPAEAVVIFPGLFDRINAVLHHHEPEAHINISIDY